MSVLLPVAPGPPDPGPTAVTGPPIHVPPVVPTAPVLESQTVKTTTTTTDRAGDQTETVVTATLQPTGWRKALWPLRSRKVQVALATLLVAWGANAGWVLNEDVAVGVLGVGVALILGIAHEDAGRKQP